MQLSVISVNWNSTAYLLKCIESVYAHTRDIEFEIIVVDNASPDTDADRLKEQFPTITLIKNRVNVGFARANNIGFRASRGEYIVLLNPDTYLLNPAFTLMLRQARSIPTAGVLGCTLFNGDLSIQTTAIQTFPTIMNQLLDLNFLRDRFPACRLWNFAPLLEGKSGACPVEVISGACLMLKRTVFEKVGLFSEDYFMYAEDLDLCLKATRAGFTNYYLPEGRIVHYGGKSSVPSRAIVMKWRSILHYLEKYRGFGYVAAFRVAMALGAVVRLVALAVSYPVMRRPRTNSGVSPLAKWWTILGIMLAPSGSTQNRRADNVTATTPTRNGNLPVSEQDNISV
jgi:GT2 family glycosyltransferase